MNHWELWQFINAQQMVEASVEDDCYECRSDRCIVHVQNGDWTSGDENKENKPLLMNTAQMGWKVHPKLN